jgi:hypothetical protein
MGNFGRNHAHKRNKAKKKKKSHQKEERMRVQDKKMEQTPGGDQAEGVTSGNLGISTGS